MRRIMSCVTALLLLGCLPGSVEAGAKVRYRREVKAPYVAGPLSPNASMVDGNTCVTEGVACVYFETTQRDTYVKVSVVDDVGDVVAGTVFQAGVDGPVAQICGSTGGFVPIEPGLRVAVSIQEGECDGRVAVATRGTVVATFAGTP